jgi:hypothetical protein
MCRPPSAEGASGGHQLEQEAPEREEHYICSLRDFSSFFFSWFNNLRPCGNVLNLRAQAEPLPLENPDRSIGCAD